MEAMIDGMEHPSLCPHLLAECIVITANFVLCYPVGLVQVSVKGVSNSFHKGAPCLDQKSAFPWLPQQYQ